MSDVKHTALLPCPFCGFDDHLYPCYEFPGTGPCTGIDCLRCGIDFTPRKRMDVYAAWNKRAAVASERATAADAELERALLSADPYRHIRAARAALASGEAP